MLLVSIVAFGCPLVAALARRDIAAGSPDAPPTGFEQWTSPLVLPSPSQDGSQGWEGAVEKARAFVANLTLEEKVNLTTGVGASGPCVGTTGTIPRLNFSGLCFQDSPLGVRLTGNNSAFPAGINVAATFDRRLMHARGAAMGEEFRGKGVNVALGPMTNLARTPEAGRAWEGFGGDPYLAGVATAETVRGIQRSGVAACVKHFVGNEQEHFRGSSNATASSSNIDDRTMHEVYSWPFREAVEAGATFIMCSYNRVNQTYACQNSKLINGFLKGESKFQGAVVSDWTAINQGVDAALAGTDVNMPGFTDYGVPDDQPDPSSATNSYWGAALVDAVNNGSVPLARLDDMVARTMSAYYLLEQDRLIPPVNLHDPGSNVQDDHYLLIREIGAASTVLLKNEGGILPLSTSVNRIAVIGSDAGDAPQGANACADRGCDSGTLAMGWGSGTANFPYLTSPLSAIQGWIQHAGENTTVTSSLDDGDLVAASSTASGSDVAIVFINSDSGEGYITVDGNAGDRNYLAAWNGGDDLVLAAAANSTEVVVVVHSVGAVDMERWIEHPSVKAVIWAGLPGQESGNSLVDVLFGKINPAGRLPFTIARARGDYPADVLYESDMPVPQITYSEGLDLDYRHFDSQDIEPRFEFGFGLSYTAFEYSSIDAEVTGRDEEAVKVSFAVTNVGDRTGHEVAQLYLSFPDAVDEPARVLRGFARPYLGPGQSEQITLALRRMDISTWSIRKQDWVVPEGDFTAHVGSSSRTLRLSRRFRI